MSSIVCMEQKYEKVRKMQIFCGIFCIISQTDKNNLENQPVGLLQGSFVFDIFVQNLYNSPKKKVKLHFPNMFVTFALTY